jgi:uncharacterized membrane protein SirB2
MIQRIQSVYLLLAFLCMVLLLFFPIFSVEASSADGEVILKAVVDQNGVNGADLKDGSFPLYLVYIALALFSAACILLYKKRPRQLMITRINLILHLLLIVGIYVFYYFGAGFVEEGVKNLTGKETTVIFYMEVGFFILIPAFAFIMLAIRGIRRDENLVKSLDRLR